MKGRKPLIRNPMNNNNPIGKPPEALSRRAKALYTQLASELSHVTTTLDTMTLSIYCATYDKFLIAEEQLKEQGMVVGEKVNPLVRIQDSLMKHLRQIGSELGLSPLSRGRIQSGEVPHDDLDDFLEGK